MSVPILLLTFGAWFLSALAVEVQHAKYPVTVLCTEADAGLVRSCGIERVRVYKTWARNDDKLRKVNGLSADEPIPVQLRWASYSEVLLGETMDVLGELRADLVISDYDFVLGKAAAAGQSVRYVPVNTEFPTDGTHSKREHELLSACYRRLENQAGNGLSLEILPDAGHWSDKNLLLLSRHWIENFPGKERYLPAGRWGYWGPLMGPRAFEKWSPHLEQRDQSADAELYDQVERLVRDQQKRLIVASFGTVVADKLVFLFYHHFCQIYRSLLAYAESRPDVVVLLGVLKSAKLVRQDGQSFLQVGGPACAQRDDCPGQALLPLPTNVLVVEWMALRRVLPLASASICHGGLNTTVETMSNRVPLLVLPFRGDQFSTAQLAERVRRGRSLHFLPDCTDDTPEDKKFTAANLARTLDQLLAGQGVDQATNELENATDFPGNRQEKVHAMMAWALKKNHG